MKGATPEVGRGYHRNLYFNPRTREGCDSNERKEFQADVRISIHAPVKGATVATAAKDDAFGISIHAPVKGATVKASGAASP